jgi:serralysin
MNAVSRALTFRINPTGNAFIDGVLHGTGWAPAVVHYAFPTSPNAYGYNGEKGHNFGVFNTALKNTALFALEKDFGSSANDGFSVEGFTVLDLASGNASASEIRFAFSSLANPTAYAYLPSNDERAGDVWMGTSEPSYLRPQPGNDAWLGLIHEIGHALGLKHGHENDGKFHKLPAKFDSLEYSIMTYNTFVGDDGNSWKYEKFGAPQTFMMADIAALQRLYGADFRANAGNTVYSWTPKNGDTFINGKKAIDAGGDVIFATIWDGSGKDTYDLSAYSTDLDIDLQPGAFSVFKKSQLADLNVLANDGNIARGNIFNALQFKGDDRSLIEHAIGGSGDDRLNGNSAANFLKGNGGSDTIGGMDGDDRLTGGQGGDFFFFADSYDKDRITDFTDGQDKLFFSGLSLNTETDALVFMKKSGHDTVFDFGAGDVLTLANINPNQITSADIVLA